VHPRAGQQTKTPPRTHSAGQLMATQFGEMQWQPLASILKTV
jgi:hypothetical protein